MAQSVGAEVAPTRITRPHRVLRLRGLTWEIAVYALILLGAIGLRFWDLGGRALHHDESLHATFSWYFVSGRGYQHDPLMHGPFQFHANALVFKLFGDSDYTSRIAAAFFGTLLVIMPWFLRKQLGRIGALVASLLLALSPTVVYFSRFTREDIYFACFTFGLVIALFRYLDGRQSGWLYLAAAMLALSFATKEVAFMTAALLLVYLNVLVGIELWQRWQQGKQRTWPIMLAALLGFVAAAWILVTLWPFSATVRRRFPNEALSAPAESLLVIGTLVAPQCAAALQFLFAVLGIPFQQGTATLFGYDFRGDGSLALLTVLTLLGLSAYVGTSWNPKRWLYCAAAFYVPYVLLFTTFFNNPAGFGSGIWGSLDYWLSQHDVRRGDQPAYYYALLLPVYEFLPLLLALVGSVLLISRGDRFTWFLLFWTVAIFFGLSWAGEKMPWLTVHIALPLALVGAKAVNELAGNLPRARITRSKAVTAVALLTLGAVLLGLTLRATILASFVHGDTPVELLIYTQTAPDIPALMRRIEQAATETGKGHDLPVVVDATDSFSWPWAWYLRHYKQVTYPTVTPGYEPPLDAVLLLNYGNASVVGPYQEFFGAGIPYHHRWWFPETYRGITPSSFLISLFKARTWERWLDYFLWRRPPAALGSVDGIAFFPAGLTESSTAAESRAVLRRAGPELIIGKAGIRRGEFLRPTGLTLDNAGNLYVMDSNNHRLQKLDRDGNVLATVGLRGSQPGSFMEPWGVAVDRAGNVYVADTWNHRIQKLDSNLRPVRTWGQPTQNIAQPGPADLYGPRAIAVDEAGNLWVTDTGHSRIIKFNSDGEVLAIYGGPGSGPGRFQEPVGIAIGPDGSIYVADTWNRRIQRFNREFVYQGEVRIEGWGSRDILAKPYLAVLPDGRLILTDPANGRLGLADMGSGTVIAIDRFPSGERPAVPIGVAADNNVVYISDARENVIRQIALDALIQ